MIRCAFLFLVAASSAIASSKSSGTLESYYKQYSFASTDEFSNQSAGFNGSWKWDWKGSREWKFKSELEIWTDFASKDSQEKFQGNPRNFYLENKSSPVTARFGFQTIVPDGPDIVNPADVIHARNYIDPTSPKTLASAGLSLSQEINEWQWEIFYIPQQTTPVLPGSKSAWWPREKRLPIESEDVEIRIPPNTQYEIEKGEEIDNALKNNFSARLIRKSESFEGQLLYYNGLSNDPFLNLNMATHPISLGDNILSVDSPVRLKPLYFRHQVVAGTFLVPIKSWVLKGGANWEKPLGNDSRLPRESSAQVIGLEKNVETRKGIITLILQHESQQKLDQQQISFMRSVFVNAWSFGLRVPWGEDTQFLGGAIYDTVGRSSIYRLSASRRLSDAWTLEAEGTLLEGSQETLLGLYDRYDHWGVGITYHF